MVMSNGQSGLHWNGRQQAEVMAEFAVHAGGTRSSRSCDLSTGEAVARGSSPLYIAPDFLDISSKMNPNPKKMTDLDILANLAIMFTIVMEVPLCLR